MPKVSNIEVLYKNEQPTLSIRVNTPVSELPKLIGETYEKLAAYLKELGEYLADMPFVAYHNMDMQNLDVEIGFPVAKTLPGKADIKAGTIPAGKQIFCIYRGPYTDLEPTYTEMAKYIQDNNLKPTGTSYEHYLNGPNVPEDELLTIIVMPVE